MRASLNSVMLAWLNRDEEKRIIHFSFSEPGNTQAWSTNFSIFYIYIEFSPVRLSAMARNDPSAK